MNIIVRPIWLLFSAFILLSSCTVLSQSGSRDIYRLPPSNLVPGRDGEVELSLRIARPAASGVLGGNRIAVILSGNTLSAYGNAVWNAPAPVLWRDHILDSFHKDGRIRRLSSDSDGLQADYELGGTLRSFQSEYRNGVPQVVISLDARLIDTGTRRIVSGRRFTVIEAVKGDKVPEVVAAFGSANDALARKLIDWTMRHMKPKPEPFSPGG
ncbi:MAG: membrane integrity-associated transporter subunit PqiC [Deltaproteobacteria bacterium]|nr:membrane integrity-associated transporter subunit PqiC [Deltaproteobacteria bacterium]